MNQKTSNQFVLAFGICLTLIACNQNEKKTEETVTADSTATVKTETIAVPEKQHVMDAVTVAPNLYKIVGDTLGIRMLEATYNPGDSSGMHSHPDNAIYAIAGGQSLFTLKDGTTRTVDLKSGTIIVSGDATHSVKNIGKTKTKVLVVEINRPRGALSPDAALDATKIAPDRYKAKSDSLGIRVLLTNYKSGQASALHAHPDVAIYAISGGTAEFTAKDGSKRTTELKTGMSAIMPADTHAVKNIGKSNMQIFIVEVYRAIK